jgi:hypothetical protein
LIRGATSSLAMDLETETNVSMEFATAIIGVASLRCDTGDAQQFPKAWPIFS